MCMYQGKSKKTNTKVVSRRNVLKNCCINENKKEKRKKKENRMLMSAIKSIKIAKLVFTQKEFD